MWGQEGEEEEAVQRPAGHTLAAFQAAFLAAFQAAFQVAFQAAFRAAFEAAFRSAYQVVLPVDKTVPTKIQ